MPTIEQVRDWTGEELVGQDDERLGTISHVYLDHETGEPSFVSVKTGLFGMKSSLVPIADAHQHDDHIHVAFTKDQVKDAPNVDEDEELSPEEERRLYAHYSMGFAGGYDGPAHTESTDSGATAGRDTSGPSAEQAMTRSEEELRVGTRTTESGHARLRKYVVTEEVNATIPVSHEEATIVREPVTDENADAANSGADISEAEHEVTLHAEEPVVEKDVVAKERVRLDTRTVTEDAPVTDTVRKEQVETDGDVQSGDRH
jgi:uncharacterized protein (TIGR02271 family)